MNKLAWLEAEARQFFHLINIAVVIDLINPYHFLSNETKLKLGFAYFKYYYYSNFIEIYQSINN